MDLYLVLTQTGSIPSRILKLYTKDPYNHISIGFSKNLDKLFSFGRRTPHNPLNGGFVEEGIDRGMYNIFKSTICSVYKINVSKEEYENVKRIIELFNNRKDDYRYNFLGLFTAFWGIPLNREHHYYCTQFVAKVLQTSRITEFKKDISFLKPIDFSNLKDAKLIYEGRLSNYIYKDA